MDNCDLILNSFKLQGYCRSWVSRHFWCFFGASSNFPSDSRTFPMFPSVVADAAARRCMMFCLCRATQAKLEPCDFCFHVSIHHMDLILT